MRTTTPRRVLVLCTTVTVLALAAGCTDTGPDEQASASRSARSETQAAEREAEAVQAAEQAVRDYWRVTSQCLADPPNTDPSCFEEVSVDDQLTKDKKALSDAQQAGVWYEGQPTYVRTEKVVDVQLSGQSVKEVRLSVCTSIAGYDAFWPDGTSVIPPDEPERAREVYVVRKWTDKWQVADFFDDPEGTEC